MLHAEVEDDAGPRFARPGEAGFVVAFDQADRAVNNVPAVTAGEDADAVEERGEVAARDVKFGDHFASGASGAGAGIDLGVVAFGVIGELVRVGPVDLPLGGKVMIAVNLVNALFVDVGEEEEMFPIFRTQRGGPGGGRFAWGRFVDGENSATEEVVGFRIDGELEIAIERAARDSGIEFRNDVVGNSDFDNTTDGASWDELQSDGIHDAEEPVAADDETEEFVVFVAAAAN